MLQNTLGISCLHMDPNTAVSSNFTVFTEDQIAFPAWQSLQSYIVEDQHVDLLIGVNKMELMLAVMNTFITYA